jgi:peptide deformylase
MPSSPTASTSPVEKAADQFAAELTRWRLERGLTKKQLAAQMGFDPSYVSHVEGRRHRPTEDFARRAEAVLGAGGAIWLRFQDYDDLRHARTAGQAPLRDPPVPEQWMPPGTGLIVEQEVASLAYRDGVYRCVIRRALYNAGTEPVTRYLVRIAVDRFPNDPTRSNRHHRDRPLTFAELDLQAYCGDPPTREPMLWRTKHDRDAFKEVWLLFENADGRFPLYPGERITIEYAYSVSEEKWGQWFQRAVRLPTRRLAVRLDFPLGRDPQVWGVETSLSSEEVPLRTPVVREVDAERVRFEWSTDAPPLNARYRLEWRFRSQPTTTGGAPSLPSERMRDAGIVQRGEGVLTRPAARFTFPADAATARDVTDRLMHTLTRVEELHPFTKGVGLAAPQIGAGLAAAVVRPPDRTAPPLVLLNPRVVEASAETDEQYEGCLSFFDVRGLVPRPLRIDVEHLDWDGTPRITSFEYGMARLVAHEIDHLEATLYDARMAPGVPLVPIAEYRDTGRPWSY